MRGALAGNPVGVMEEARKTLMAAYQSAKPAGKKALQKFLDDPEAFTALPEQVIERLAKGDVSAVADAARFTSLPTRTGGQWVPHEGDIYSPEAIALGAGTAGAIGVGIAAGGAVANPKPSSPADLSDGLAGAPQDDITPEPVAGESSPPPAEPPPAPSTRDDDLLRQFDAALPTNPRLREQYEALYPPRGTPEGDSARARYQEHINSLPQNSPEAKARNRKRWAEQDSRMGDFDTRMHAAMNGGQVLASDTPGGRTMSGLPASRDPSNPRWGGDEDRVRELMAANPDAFLGPDELTPEQEDHKQLMLDNRKSYYDQRYYATAPDLKAPGGRSPVFQPKLKEFRVPYDPSNLPQDTIPGTGNEELGVPAYDRFEYTDAARRMLEGEDAASFMEGSISLKDRQLARRLLDWRADRVARQTGRNKDEVFNELMKSGSFYRDPPSGRLMLRSGADTRNSTRQQQIDDLALRREKVKQRGEMGLLASQSALSNNVVNARRILRDPNASEEERLAAKYWLSPHIASIELARAQNPPRGDGSGFDPVTANALKQQYAAGYKDGTEEAKSRLKSHFQWGKPKKPKDAREWEDWRQQALEGLAINSAEYDGAKKWFEDNFGAQPPGDREEPEQSGVPISGARQGPRRGGR